MKKDTVKYSIKLKKLHPANRMFLQDHVITNEEKVFELTKEEVTEMKSNSEWFAFKKEASKGKK